MWFLLNSSMNDSDPLLLHHPSSQGRENSAHSEVILETCWLFCQLHCDLRIEIHLSCLSSCLNLVGLMFKLSQCL